VCVRGGFWFIYSNQEQLLSSWTRSATLAWSYGWDFFSTSPFVLVATYLGQPVRYELKLSKLLLLCMPNYNHFPSNLLLSTYYYYYFIYIYLFMCACLFLCLIYHFKFPKAPRHSRSLSLFLSKPKLGSTNFLKCFMVSVSHYASTIRVMTQRSFGVLLRKNYLAELMLPE